MDWEKVEADANTEIPADVAYKLSWGSLRRPGITLKMGSSRKKQSKTADPAG